MSHRALGPQFHFTRADLAPRVLAEGFKLRGETSDNGFGGDAQQYGPGVYTASEHASETWAAEMINGNPNPVSLKKLEVDVDPDARVHTYKTYEDLPGGSYRKVSVEDHIGQHPDIAAHYDRSALDRVWGKGSRDKELARAAQAAGYDALHVDSGNVDQTVHFDPSKLRAR